MSSSLATPTGGRSASEAAARRFAVGPLVALLQGELATAGIPPTAPEASSLPEFTRWYLQVVQRLEAHVAGSASAQPMLREEVELMCRCALSGVDLRQAMAICARFCDALRPRAGRLTLSSAGGRAWLRLDSLRAETSTTSSLCDITGLFAFFQLCQWLVGVELRLTRVSIGPVRREDVLPFLQLFRAPVLSGGSDYALEFPAANLDLPVIRTPGEFEAFFRVYPCGLFDHGMHGLPQQVAALLSAATRQGGGLPSQQDIAYTLGWPLSTFRRRLAESGLSFRRIREGCLRDEAARLLAQGQMSVGEIAVHLGYSDATAFRRAFRQWYGCAPAVWRRTRGGGNFHQIPP